jgi:hypothetical protein
MELLQAALGEARADFHALFQAFAPAGGRPPPPTAIGWPTGCWRSHRRSTDRRSTDRGRSVLALHRFRGAARPTGDPAGGGAEVSAALSDHNSNGVHRWGAKPVAARSKRSMAQLVSAATAADQRSPPALEAPRPGVEEVDERGHNATMHWHLLRLSGFSICTRMGRGRVTARPPRPRRRRSEPRRGSGRRSLPAAASCTAPSRTPPPMAPTMARTLAAAPRMRWPPRRAASR